ncbi:hypothetical protein AVEN_274268-1 [Araneus ventricosus]|uniref:Uncharacterized protein n=1 Tax=Araneus ventricosus TaxID=182803 RepID=A0A4Y2LE04_ARAVE|nr:hypothetical protein AVEN_274268-1 [Araneus ventricosus]
MSNLDLRGIRPTSLAVGISSHHLFVQDTIKEAVSKASELLMYGVKIVGYVVDALGFMYDGFQSSFFGGKTVLDTIKEAVSKASELLMYGMKVVGYVVDALGFVFAGLKSIFFGGKAVLVSTSSAALKLYGSVAGESDD